MTLPIFIIDAFTSRVLAGNPAAVCPLDDWPEDGLLQGIAAENNLSETAFLAPEADGYRLRWFTPVVEVDLCGHATLAAAFVVLRYLDAGRERVVFATRSGPLTVTAEGELLTMDFPALPLAPLDPPDALGAALGVAPREAYLGADCVAVYASEGEVRALRPNQEALRGLPGRGVIATAPGADCDFVSRFFAPKYGIPEDPVTGSAHCLLTPYWARRLGKHDLHARQVSARGGELFCRDLGQWVALSGRAVRYLEGRIWV